MGNGATTYTESAGAAPDLAADGLNSVNDRLRALPWDRLAVVAIAASATLTLAISVLFTLAATPMADDFWRAVKPANRGWWLYMWEDMYLKWTGRWSGIGLTAAVNPRVDLLRHYPILLSILYVVHVLAAYAFCRMLLRETASRRVCLLLGLALWAIIWAGLPAPGQTMYWLAGNVDYQLSTSLAVILLAWLTAPWRDAEPAWRSVLRALGLSALTLIVTGMHEMIAAMLVIVIGLGTVIAWRAKHPARWIWTAVALATVVGAAISILAPGNAVRGAKHEGGGDLLATIRITATVFLKHAPAWFCDPKVLAAGVSLLAWPWFMRQRPRWVELGRFIPGGWFIVWIVTLPMVVGVGIAGSAWGMGGQPNGRALDQLWTIVVFGLFAGLFMISREFALPREATAASEHRLLRAFACTILALALVFTGNTRHGLDDLQDGLLWPWRRAIYQWSDAAKEAHARGQQDLVVPPRPVVPRLYYAEWDLSTEPDRYQNRYFATYHGIGTIRVAEPSPGTREHANELRRRGWQPWLVVD